MFNKSLLQAYFDHFLNQFYCIQSFLYLSSYSGGSIYDHHSKFLLLKPSQCFLISLSVKERFQFFLAFIIIFYYTTFGFDLIKYPDDIRFIAGDILLLLSNQARKTEKIAAIMLLFSFCTLIFIVYISFNTNSSLSFRTIILYSYEAETNKTTLDIFRQKYSLFSSNTVIFLDYISKKTSISVAIYKQFFNRFYIQNAVFYCKYFCFALFFLAK